MTLVFTWLWQGVAVAVLTALVLRALPRVNAATRHLTWWGALAAVLGIPWVLIADTVRAGIPRLSGTADPLEAAIVLPAVPEWVGVACASAWMLVALCGVIRVARGCFVVRSLRHRSMPFEPAREARLSLWADAAVLTGRPVMLRMSDEITGACAIGFRRPVILVGRQLAHALRDEALEQIVMHEQAHLARYDDWLRLVQAVVEAVAGLHPAVWWLSRRIDLDREAACDDSVVAYTGAARQYASALLDAATTAAHGPVLPAIVPGVAGSASALRRRVVRLLDPARARGVRPTSMATVAMTLPVLAVVASPPLAPLVAFVEAVEHVLPLPAASAPTGDVPAARPGVRGTDIASPARMQAAAGRGRRKGRTSEPLDARAPVTHGVTGATAAAPGTGVQHAAPVPLESRPLTAGLNALAPSAPADTMTPQVLAGAPGRSPWQAIATSSAGTAKNTASGVASGAEKGGVAIGRAFTRAAQAITAGF